MEFQDVADRSSPNPSNAMKISAKTSARTKMQKAECHHGFSHVLRSTWNFARMFAEGLV
jgi:hypothetical protein